MEVGFCEFLEVIYEIWLRFDADFECLVTKCYYWVRTDYADYTDFLLLECGGHGLCPDLQKFGEVAICDIAIFVKLGFCDHRL